VEFIDFTWRRPSAESWPRDQRAKPPICAVTSSMEPVGWATQIEQI
jgi:hypothetical protein